MQIELTHGQVAIIDDADFWIISAFKWRAHYCESVHGYYATTSRCIGGKKIHLLMHRLILDAPKGFDVDHRNHNTLDNRRENIRVCTRKENLANGKFALATHCPHGHPYDETNTYFNPKGGRVCRTCAYLKNKEVRENRTPEERQIQLQRQKDWKLRNPDKLREERTRRRLRKEAARLMST